MRRIDIVSVKVWLLRRWRLAQGFFNTLIMEGETMTAFACGLGRGFDNLIIAGITIFITISVSTLVLVVAAVAATRRWLKSRGPE